MKETYMKALRQARSELSELLKRRAELDERVARLAKSIEGLEALCDEKDHSAGLIEKIELNPDSGLSEAIRQVLAASILPLRAPSIRDALVEEGFDPSEYSNMLTAIHNTLGRLEKQGEVTKVRLPGIGFWGWTRLRAPGLPPPPKLTPSSGEKK